MLKVVRVSPMLLRTSIYCPRRIISLIYIKAISRKAHHWSLPVTSPHFNQYYFAVDLEVDLEAVLEVDLEAVLEADLEVDLEAVLEADLEVDLEVGLEVDLEVDLGADLEVGLEVDLDLVGNRRPFSLPPRLSSPFPDLRYTCFVPSAAILAQ